MSSSCKILLLISLLAMGCGKSSRSPKVQRQTDKTPDQIDNGTGSWTDPSVRPPGSADAAPPAGMPGTAPGTDLPADSGTLPGAGTLPVPGTPAPPANNNPSGPGDSMPGTLPPAGGGIPAPDPTPTPPPVG